MTIRAISFAIAAAAMALPSASFAQEVPIALSSNILLVKTSSDSEQLIEAAEVVPGDTLEFITTFRNHTGETISDFTLVNPVPENVVVSQQSAEEIEVSVDGGESWGMLAELDVAAEDGTRRPASSADVTHMRWVIAELAPDQTGSITYRADIK